MLKMTPTKRRKLILERIAQDKEINIEELSLIFFVSHMTIRRDIEKLEADGLIKKSTTGVNFNEFLAQEIIYEEKKSLNIETKKKIAMKSLEYIKDNMSIALDAGTTTLEIARHLHNFKNLKIVTPDHNIALYLSKNSTHKIIHTGGVIDSTIGASFDQIAKHTLGLFFFDISFVATSSWDIEHGITTPSLEKAMYKKRLIENARDSILITDSSKFRLYGEYRIAKLSSFKVIITDQNTNTLNRDDKQIQELPFEIV